jgi:peptidoglycan/xylan/chitin deacetylase (PgdA/CDA1 family)
MDDAVHVDAWTGAAGVTDRTWNLRTASGRRVPPGLYTVAVMARDDAGNHLTSPRRPLRDVHPVSARTVRSVQGAGSRVALTFDDCGSEAAWGRILRVLRAHDARATFFCSGARALDAPALARRTVRDGNAVGSHGWDHADLTNLAPRAIADRLRRDEAAWWRTTGAMAVPLFRPPYGALDADVRRAAGATGYAWIALWDLDPRDWELPGARVIASRVLRAMDAGSIVVLHVNPQTAQALPMILRGLAGRGLEPVTILELLSRASRVEHGLVSRMPV